MSYIQRQAVAAAGAATSEYNEYERLYDVLSTPEQHAFFETFLRNLHAHENLLFIEALSELRHETDNCANVRNITQRIVRTFLIPNAPLEINVQNKITLSQLLEKYDENGAISKKEALQLLRGAEMEVKIFLNEKVIEFDRIYKPLKLNIHDPDYNRFQKKVVIIGGGFTGFTVASILDPMPRFHVTLIDTKDSFEYTPGMIKLLVRPEETSSLRVRHDAYVKNGRVVIGYAEQIVNGAKAVKVDNGYILFDYLVIATGSLYHSKLKSFDTSSVYRLSELSAEHKQLKEAKSVLIIGGGLVGCELANEIAMHSYPSPYDEKKKITLIDSHTTLVQRSSPKKQQDILQDFERLGIKVILNEKIIDLESNDTNSFLGSSGTVYSGFDKVFIATGCTPCSKIIQASNVEDDNDFQSCVDGQGRIRVKPTLQLNHWRFPYVFAGGDVTNVVEEKTGYAATLAGACIARNICRMEKGKPPLKQGTKGTLPAPAEPLHDEEAQGKCGWHPLNSLKKTFFFLNPTWAALKYFDEHEFLALVQGETKSINAFNVFGKKPRKLDLPCEYYKLHPTNDSCNLFNINASVKTQSPSTAASATHPEKTAFLAPFEVHCTPTTLTNQNLPLQVSTVNLSGSDIVSNEMQDSILHKLSFVQGEPTCCHGGVLSSLPPQIVHSDTEKRNHSNNDNNNPGTLIQQPVGMTSQFSLRSLKYFDL